MKKIPLIATACCAFALSLTSCDGTTEITEEELFELLENFAEQEYKTIHYISESAYIMEATGSSSISQNDTETTELITDIKTSGDYYYYESSTSNGVSSRIEIVPTNGGYTLLAEASGTSSSSTSDDIAECESVVLSEHEEALSEFYYSKDDVETILSLSEDATLTTNNSGDITISYEVTAMDYVISGGFGSFSAEELVGLTATGSISYEIKLNQYGYLISQTIETDGLSYVQDGGTMTYNVNTTETVTYDGTINKTQRITL